MHSLRTTILTPVITSVILALGACTGGETPPPAADAEPPAATEAAAAKSATGRWQLTDINGTAPLADAESWLEIDLAAGQLSGSAGCNNFTGGFDSSTDALSLGPLAMTKKMCEGPLMDQETKVLEVLTAVSAMSVDADGLLELRGTAGQLKAKRAPAP
ncbi:MAG: META domain-containing protein [Pseudomonadota bacterium]